MAWFIPNHGSDFDGCNGCKWLHKNDNEEPCVLCLGTQKLNEMEIFGKNPNFYNAEEMPDEPVADMDTVKDKAGKPRMGLVLPHAAEALVRVREYGLQKYPDADNWRKVPKEDWLDAMMRHMMKYIAGQEIDSESGLPHLWHALCNLSYMIEGEQDGNQ